MTIEDIINKNKEELDKISPESNIHNIDMVLHYLYLNHILKINRAINNKFLDILISRINIIKNFQNKFLFEPLYAQPLYTQCSSINFFKDKSCLTIGMYDGSIKIYKIFINETTPETLPCVSGFFYTFAKK